MVLPRVLRQGRAPALAWALLLAVGCAEKGDPVTWTASVDGPGRVAPGSLVRIRVDAKIGRGWYFYSLTQPAGGPVPSKIWLEDSSLFRPAGMVSGPAPTRAFDNTFGIDVEKHFGNPSFTLPVTLPPNAATGASRVRVNAMYQACNDTVCLPPRTVTLTVPLTIEPR